MKQAKFIRGFKGNIDLFNVKGRICNFFERSSAENNVVACL